MNIVTNEKMIRRNARIGQYTMVASMAILAAGMVINFQRQDQLGISLSLGALFFGFALSQVGFYFMNRWGRRPRADEQINKALIGLDKRFTIYHYASPVSHLLVGPAGVWILLPRYQRGRVSFSRDRWHVTEKNLGRKVAAAYLRLFAQDTLGRPDMEIEDEVKTLRKFLQEKLPENKVPPIYAALVMTSPDIEVDESAEETPLGFTLALGKLKDGIRKSGKARTLQMDRVDLIVQALKNPETTEKTVEGEEAVEK